ncbi:MAG TPA: MBL fold metallo-hydrolase [Solimonas sp.]
MSQPPRHHRPYGFRNNYSVDRHSTREALAWLPKFLMQKWVRPDFPVRTPDLTPFDGGAQAALSWIGHSTFLVQWGGKRLLTDPVFGRRASPVGFAGPERLTRAAMKVSELPPVDFALISHNHYDHLDDGTVRRLAKRFPQITFVVPLGLKAWFAQRGITRVVELDWWDSAEVCGLRVHAVPAQHFSGRSTSDRNRTLWCGFIVEDPQGKKLYFAGDTGYSQDFPDIGARFAPVDLALLPIGAYAPRWFMKSMHVNPDEAVQIHQDLQSRQSVAMHWGTFRLTEEPLDEPPQRLREVLRERGIDEQRFWVLAHGETRVL